MTSNDILSAYENLAGLTGQMALAARDNDLDSFCSLENQCAHQVSSLKSEATPALSGSARLRKIDLLKAILANDREIRAITDPWQTQLSSIMTGNVSVGATQ